LAAEPALHRLPETVRQTVQGRSVAGDLLGQLLIERLPGFFTGVAEPVLDAPRSSRRGTLIEARNNINVYGDGSALPKRC
jgi:hypothetical protein